MTLLAQHMNYHNGGCKASGDEEMDIVEKEEGKEEGYEENEKTKQMWRGMCDIEKELKE